jgi:hypothetical protein
MSLPSTTAKGVVKVLSYNIIFCFGLVKNIDSGNGSHFLTNIIKNLTKALGLK